MSTENSMNFTALLLIAQSLQTTPAAMSIFSQPAIEMVHQAADSKRSSRRSSSRSSSLVRFCMRRTHTSSSLSSELTDDSGDHSDSGDDTTVAKLPSEEDNSCTYYSPDSFKFEDPHGHHSNSGFVAEPEQMSQLLMEKPDPRDFMKTGIPPNLHHHYHYHRHHRYQE